MASVDDFLEDTMLAAAGRGYQKALTSSEDLSLFPILIESSPPKPSEGTDDEDAAIWGYGVPTVGGGVHLTDLTCRVSSMKYAAMGVCDSIDWGPVTFTTERTARPVTLPLEPDYLLKARCLSAGHITSDDPYWKLPANTDQSFELVFGYEYPNYDQIGDPVPMVKMDGQYFSPRGPERQNRISVFPPGSKGSSTLRVSPLRILIVVTLVCCKQRYDFDPGGALGAGRFYPMIMAVSNHELKTVTGKITIARPTQVKMIPDDPSEGSPHCHIDPHSATVLMDGEEMTKDLSVAFFTDSNRSFTIPTAIWGSLFDYYDVNPAAGSYVFTVPWKDKSRRTVPGVEVIRTVAWEDMGIPQHNKPDYPWLKNKKPKGPAVFVRREKITKTAGQGEFDNLHIAPKMIIRPQYVTSTRTPKEKLTGLDRITMAPFCIHDCMHLHVRWGADNTGVSSRGWLDEESPNALAGAPLVPPNQKVTINVLSPASFEYIAEARGVRVGTWQIMLHHGAAYALDTGKLATIARWVSPDCGVSASERKWASMYWNLRWDVAKDGVQYERLSWDPGALPKLREAGSLPEAAPKAAASAAGN